MENVQLSQKIQLPFTVHRGLAVLESYSGQAGIAHVFQGRLNNLPGLVGELIAAGESDPGFFQLDLPFTIGAGPVTDPIQLGSIREKARVLWQEYCALVSRQPAQAAKAREQYLRIIDPRLIENPRIAVKTCRRAAPDSPEAARLAREDQALRKLNHRNILRRYAWLEDPVLGPYLLLEHVQGKTLDRIWRRRQEMRQPLPLAAVAHVGYQLVLALQHAHGQGVAHGDLQPANILMEEATREEAAAGKAKGLVKLTGFGSEGPAGAVSLAYAAPEQLRFGAATQGTDVYQVGTVLFALVTGRLPYEAASPEEMREQISSLDPHPNRVHHFRPDVSAKFEALIEGAREKNPGKRWPLTRVLEEMTQVYASRLFSLEDGPRGSIAEELLGRVQTNIALKDFYRALEALDLVADFLDGVAGEKGGEVRRRHEALLRQCEPYRPSVETLKRIHREHIAPVDHLMEELYTRYGNGEPLLSKADKGIIRENEGDVVIVKRSLLDGILEHTAAAIRDLGQIDPDHVGDMHRKMVDRASSQEVACSDLAARLIKFGDDYHKINASSKNT